METNVISLLRSHKSAEICSLGSSTFRQAILAKTGAQAELIGGRVVVTKHGQGKTIRWVRRGLKKKGGREKISSLKLGSVVLLLCLRLQY